MLDSIVLENPSSSTPYGSGGGRAIDRHNPIIINERRLDQSRIFPTNSPIIITSTTTSSDQHHHLHRHHLPELESEDSDPKRKSVAFSDDDNEPIKEVDFNPFISPASSSRCLLSDKSNFNYSSEFHLNPPPPSSHQRSNQPTPRPPQYERLRFLDGDHGSPSSSPPKIPSILTQNKPKPMLCCNPMPSNEKHDNPPSSATPKSPSPSPPPPSPPSSDQVVVLEVSLHCRGCERKMKKHISKIEGVKSFKIEFMAKKVTVVGDVTPLSVLTSVLKVKNAKLLTPATISSLSSSQASFNSFQQQA
ncbi:protein SODIUM POTASSIUM ROOT DEFECTIVE 1-like [Rutidosis leptorrhynchoides]|uniref:protein SODIUM POTASSIUM ROOT DEFECTIVE 1-like n=1 Tax=Rutidosis leptorrhynchoides TaxID=125765 RepID=UPI003A98D401